MAEDQIYMTYDLGDDGRVVAIISRGSPQFGDKTIEILAIESFDEGTTEAELDIWFKRMQILQPWEAKPKELQVIHGEQVKEAAAKDPELAEALRDMGAVLLQAMEGFASGKYDSFEDAMEAITGERPERIVDDQADSDD